MRVALLKGENLRAYERLELNPHPRLNLVLGPNAAGKTSLLEALYLLGRGKSFRSTDPAELAGKAGRHWTVFGKAGRDDRLDRIGVGWSGDGVIKRLNEQEAKASAVARALPMQLIDPGGHRLVEEGPGYRRSYLDWGVFHVEPGYLAHWQRYQRALRQRNQALRQNLPDAAVAAWNEELGSAALAVTAQRRRHVEQIEPRLRQLTGQLLELDDVRCEFHAGWNEQEDLRQLLQQNLAQHRRLGSTVQGPHRAELKLLVGPQRAKGRVSRGQQKLLVAALVLAQCTILTEAGVGPPVVLVDDFGAELSTTYQARFASALNAYDGQVFVTAFEEPASLREIAGAVFHVEQGRLGRP